MTKDYERKPLIVGAAFYDPDLEKPEMPAEMALLWKQYEASGDVECLAKAAEMAPFLGNPTSARLSRKYYVTESRPINLPENCNGGKSTCFTKHISTKVCERQKFMNDLRNSKELLLLV